MTICRIWSEIKRKTIFVEREHVPLTWAMSNRNKTRLVLPEDVTVFQSSKPLFVSLPASYSEQEDTKRCHHWHKCLLYGPGHEQWLWAHSPKGEQELSSTGHHCEPSGASPRQKSTAQPGLSQAAQLVQVMQSWTVYQHDNAISAHVIS